MKLILIILVLSLVSCKSEPAIEFIINNESTTIIDSVTVTTSDNRSTIKLYNIKPGQGKKERLSMRETLKGDGNYHVEINTSGVTQSDNFGYYTNGAPIEENICIHYFNDSINYDFNLK